MHRSTDQVPLLADIRALQHTVDQYRKRMIMLAAGVNRHTEAYITKRSRDQTELHPINITVPLCTASSYKRSPGISLDRPSLDSARVNMMQLTKFYT